jgi:hypothetical protein
LLALGATEAQIADELGAIRREYFFGSEPGVREQDGAHAVFWWFWWSPDQRPGYVLDELGSSQ